MCRGAQFPDQKVKRQDYTGCFHIVRLMAPCFLDRLASYVAQIKNISGDDVSRIILRWKRDQRVKDQGQTGHSYL